VEHVHPLNRPSPWRAATLAGALLVAVALAVVGGLMLVNRLERTRPVPGTGRVSKRQPATPLRPRSRVSVLVLNGNGISGAAGTEATKLLAAGYQHAIPTDASQDYATSLVLFRRGWQGEAQRLARDAGIRSVAPLDGRLPSADAEYRVVLILGSN